MPSSDPRREDSPGAASLTGAPWVVLRQIRRVIAFVVGVTVVAIGIAMIVLPGPAFVVIPLGLGILAAEFTWARHLLERLRHEGKQALGPRWQRFLAMLDAWKRPKR